MPKTPGWEKEQAAMSKEAIEQPQKVKRIGFDITEEVLRQFHVLQAALREELHMGFISYTLVFTQIVTEAYHNHIHPEDDDPDTPTTAPTESYDGNNKTNQEY